MLVNLFFRSENGLLAYGSNNLVVVVDTAKVIPVQCFTDHKSLIKKVNFFIFYRLFISTTLNTITFSQ